MALSLSWNLLARRAVAVLGFVLFVAVGVLVFSRVAPKDQAPSFLEDAQIIPRAFTKAIGSHAPLVRLEIEPDSVSAHVVEDAEHAVIYVISRESGYVSRGHRRALEPRERKDAAFAFATVEFDDVAGRVAAATQALGEPPRSIAITRPAGADWLSWRIYGSEGEVEFDGSGKMTATPQPSASAR